jgi:hypothetical protein
MTKDEKDILATVFFNLLNTHTNEKYDDFKNIIISIMDGLAHEYALHNHDLDREKYIIWHELKLMLSDTSLYESREH